MSDYFDNREYYLESIWFRYDGIVYRGNGVLRWTSEDGFHIVAKINGDSIPARKEFRSISFINPTRMRLEISPYGNKRIAITPFLRLDGMGLHFWEPCNCIAKYAVPTLGPVTTDCLVIQKFIPFNRSV